MQIADGTGFCARPVTKLGRDIGDAASRSPTRWGAYR